MSTFSVDEKEFRVVDGAVQKRAAGERRWQTVALAELAREYGVGEGPWPWLLQQGVRRPSPTQAEAERGTVQVKLRVAESTSAKFDRLVKEDGTTKSETFTKLVEDELERRKRR